MKESDLMWSRRKFLLTSVGAAAGLIVGPQVFEILDQMGPRRLLVPGTLRSVWRLERFDLEFRLTRHASAVTWDVFTGDGRHTHSELCSYGYMGGMKFGLPLVQLTKSEYLPRPEHAPVWYALFPPVMPGRDPDGGPAAVPCLLPDVE